jgi:hypothetical protein
MSWSIALIGNPDAICKALDAQSEKMSGQSKQEFDEAIPAIKTLVSCNVNGQSVRVTRNGHASFDAAGTKIQGYTAVNIEPNYGLVV